MPDPPKFYLTTPIYYVNARPHIGHAYTTIVADVIARRHRLLGDDTFFLTGTDEHGQKIARSADAAGIPPQQFADEVSATFRDLWKRMGITNDAFIRTTDPRHKQGVQRLFQTLRDRGHIYLSTYTGQYCVSDEAYVEGPPGVRCPDCGRVTETVSESNYYFRLSAFQLPLLDLIESNQLLITPDSRRNEVLSFLRGNTSAPLIQTESSDPSRDLSSRPEPEDLSSRPERSVVERPAVAAASTLPRTATGTPYNPGALRDLSISRTSFKWGIPVPGDEDHVIYVWLDALANYMTAIGYGSDAPDDIAKFERFWPADLHLVGKEIIRFHCVYWPAFLLALNPLFSEAHKRQENSEAVMLSEAKNPSISLVEPTQPERTPGAPEPPSSLPEVLEPQQTAPPTLPPEQHKAWAEKMLPKAITAHGWLLFEDSKMSKSKGNIVRTETILDAVGEHVYKKQFPDSTKQEQDLFASDVLRYFLLREIPFGQDGSFSFDALITRYNADLANGYGNLVSRTLSMINKYFEGVIPQAKALQIAVGEPHALFAELSTSPETLGETLPKVLPALVLGIVAGVAKHLEDHAFHSALIAITSLVGSADAELSMRAPWKVPAAWPLEKAKEYQSEVLSSVAESIRIITALLHPILPYATAKVWAQLGLGDIEQASENGDLRTLTWGGLQPGTKLGPLAPIFPRADKGLAQIMADIENPQQTTANGEHAAPNKPAPSKLTNETTTAVPETPLDPTHPAAPPRSGSIPEANPITQVGGSASPITHLPKPPSHTEAHASGPFASAQSAQPLTQNSQSTTHDSPVTPPASAASAAASQITIDDFAKVELRVAKILVCERIPKADKLLRLEVDLGYERRQILSGIAEWYTPEELIGRKIVVITNLAPRKMRGLDSHGMLLAAASGDDGKPALATFSEADNIEIGARLK